MISWACPYPAEARWKAARARIPIEYGSPGITDRASAGYRFSSCPCRQAIRVTRTGPKTLARPRSCPASTVRCRIPAALVTCGARSSRAASRANVACSSRRSSSRPSRPIASSRSPWSRYRDSSAAQVSRPENCSAESASAAASSPSAAASLPSSRTCLTVTVSLAATAHLRCPPGVISAHHPGNGPAARRTGNPEPPRAHPRRAIGKAADQRTQPSVTPGCTPIAQTLPTRQQSDRQKRQIIASKKRHPYLEDWEYHDTLSGVPQGGVVSPILSNIYLHKLDEFVEQELIPKYTRGTGQRPGTWHGSSARSPLATRWTPVTAVCNT